MAKTHPTLKPVTNIVLIAVWGAVAAFLVFCEPRVPISIAFAGGILGAVVGMMQHLSIAQAASGLNDASSAMDVRRALKATPWGRRYLWGLYFSKFVLAVLAAVIIRETLVGIVIGYLAGYMSLMFVREVITLRDTFYLQNLASQHESSRTAG